MSAALAKLTSTLRMHGTIGGVNATLAKMIDSTGTLCCGKKLCLHARVPPEAKLSVRGAAMGGSSTSSNADATAGLSVDVTVKDVRILKKELACSLSHFAWELAAPKAGR